MILLITVLGMRRIEANTQAKWLGVFLGPAQKFDRFIGRNLCLMPQGTVLLLMESKGYGSREQNYQTWLLLLLSELLFPTSR